MPVAEQFGGDAEIGTGHMVVTMRQNSAKTEHVRVSDGIIVDAACLRVSSYPLSAWSLWRGGWEKPVRHVTLNGGTAITWRDSAHQKEVGLIR